MTYTHKTTGVYCLANDNVLDWMIAFLESFRTHEPDRRLIVIPFDNNIGKLSQLSQMYKFEFFHDQSLEELDSIGRDFFADNHVRAHLLRKFAVFWGPLEKFLFLDSDIVILSQLEE